MRPDFPTARTRGTVIRRCFLSALVTFGLANVQLSPSDSQESSVKFSATEWHRARHLFQGDPRWLGCQTAVSVKLSDGRILWLFGESRLDPAQSRDPEKIITIHNSVALQIGHDPETAELVHFWNLSKRRPGSFFKDGPGYWFRPVDAVEIGSSLLILMFKVRIGKTDQEVVEWSAARILNLRDSPARWHLQWLPTPANQFGAVLGYGGLLQLGGYVLTGARLRDESDELFLVRWSLDRLVRFDLTTPQWWTRSHGWVTQESMKDDPDPVMSDCEGNLLISWDPMGERANLFLSSPDEPELIRAFEAPTPRGPWSGGSELASVETDYTVSEVSLSSCRGQHTDARVLCAVPLSESRGASTLPVLFRISPR